MCKHCKRQPAQPHCRVPGNITSTSGMQSLSQTPGACLCHTTQRYQTLWLNRAPDCSLQGVNKSGSRQAGSNASSSTAVGDSLAHAPARRPGNSPLCLLSLAYSSVSSTVGQSVRGVSRRSVQPPCHDVSRTMCCHRCRRGVVTQQPAAGAAAAKPGAAAAAEGQAAGGFQVRHAAVGRAILPPAAVQGQFWCWGVCPCFMQAPEQHQAERKSCRCTNTLSIAVCPMDGA